MAKCEQLGVYSYTVIVILIFSFFTLLMLLTSGIQIDVQVQDMDWNVVGVATINLPLFGLASFLTFLTFFLIATDYWTFRVTFEL